MEEVTTVHTDRSTPEFEYLEDWVRLKVQGFIQGILEEEVESLLGRAKHQRREGGLPPTLNPYFYILFNFPETDIPTLVFANNFQFSTR